MDGQRFGKPKVDSRVSSTSIPTFVSRSIRDLTIFIVLGLGQPLLVIRSKELANTVSMNSSSNFFLSGSHSQLSLTLGNRKTYSDIVGPENAAKYKDFIYVAGSASAEFIADVGLVPMEAVKVRMQTTIPPFATGLVDATRKFHALEGTAG
jgi:hypothetical protein